VTGDSVIVMAAYNGTRRTATDHSGSPTTPEALPAVTARPGTPAFAPPSIPSDDQIGELVDGLERATCPVLTSAALGQRR